MVFDSLSELPRLIFPLSNANFFLLFPYFSSFLGSMMFVRAIQSFKSRNRPRARIRNGESHDRAIDNVHVMWFPDIYSEF